MYTEYLHTDAVIGMMSAIDIRDRVLHQIEGDLSTRGFGTQAMHDVDKALDRIIQGSGLVVLEQYIEGQAMHVANQEHPDLFRARAALEQEFLSATVARAAIRRINDMIEACVQRA